jgi:hypothetical protein
MLNPSSSAYAVIGIAAVTIMQITIKNTAILYKLAFPISLPPGFSRYSSVGINYSGFLTLGDFIA